VFYVSSQERSCEFYRAVLGVEPILNVPGMTEFPLVSGGNLGLMPEEGVVRLLGRAIPDPATASGVPRAELYLVVDDASVYHSRSIANGAKEVSPLLERAWGDFVAYSMDSDGHVLAFAEHCKSGTAESK
jgi:catechol 2,3-dioxygenase-like lactoylglutathione lyase family enzyme